MKQFLTVIVFALLTIAFFSGFSNFGIPRIEPAPPPSQEKIDLGAMDMVQFLALGERLVTGKGTCTLCHNNLGRAPLLEKIVTNAKLRLADGRYQGEATDLESYMYESMVKPSAYVVSGFGKKGTNDTQSPMPVISGGGIALSEAEMAAIMAYLQNAGGAEVTVKIPTDAAEVADNAGDGAPDGEPREAFENVDDILAEFTCGVCHKVAGEEGDVGPDLTKIGATRDRTYLRRSILAPNADIAPGFDPDIMPPDIASQIYASELEMLLDYLVSLK